MCERRWYALIRSVSGTTLADMIGSMCHWIQHHLYRLLGAVISREAAFQGAGQQYLSVGVLEFKFWGDGMSPSVVLRWMWWVSCSFSRLAILCSVQHATVRQSLLEK